VTEGNLGSAERRERFVVGIMALAAGVLLALTSVTNSPYGWIGLVFAGLPAWGCFKLRKCASVILTARGMRNVDAGNERLKIGRSKC
jgi:hypothetical protein